jgi:hypothetical protein
MADEILYAGLADQTTTEVLSAKVLFLLADRNAMPNHPALAAGYQGEIQGRGSRVLKVPHVGIMGYNLLATASEGSGTANTPYTDSSSTLTLAMKEKIYEPSDMARLIDATGMLNAQTFAVDAVVSKAATMLSMLANLVGGFGTSVGSSGVNATARNHVDAITALNVAGAGGPYLAVYHPTQFGDMTADSALVSGGAAQYSPEIQMLMQGLAGIGYKGEYFGVPVFTTLHVPTTNGGADRAGGMFGTGGIIWADGQVPVDPDPNIIVLENGKLIFERVRDGRASLTGYKSQFPIAMSRGLDGAGVAVITDA